MIASLTEGVRRCQFATSSWSAAGRTQGLADPPSKASRTSRKVAKPGASNNLDAFAETDDKGILRSVLNQRRDANSGVTETRPSDSISKKDASDGGGGVVSDYSAVVHCILNDDQARLLQPPELRMAEASSDTLRARIAGPVSDLGMTH
jgi:hypothetical protein